MGAASGAKTKAKSEHFAIPIASYGSIVPPEDLFEVVCPCRGAGTGAESRMVHGVYLGAPFLVFPPQLLDHLTLGSLALGISVCFIVAGKLALEAHANFVVQKQVFPSLVLILQNALEIREF